MKPHLFTLDKFQFSENYLDVGPVLIMQKNTKKAFDANEEIQVAVSSEDFGGIVTKHYPHALVKIFGTDLKCAMAVQSGQVDTALVSRLVAVGFVKDQFNTLKIATKPLTDEGLKLITLHAVRSNFIKRFDRGLEEIRKSGEYEKLLVKWKLTDSN